MAGVIKMACTLVVPEFREAAGDMETKFANGLINNAAIINDRRIAKVGSDGAYISKVAGPSNAGWVGMVNPAFVAKNGRDATAIAAAHQQNGAGSFAKWNRGLDLAFATRDGVVAKDFVQKVSDKKENWTEAAGKKTLRFTGDKVRGLGVSSIIPALMIGYQPAIGWLQPADSWQAGLPYKICPDGLEGTLKAALTQMITRTGMTIVQSNFLVATITAQNTLLQSLLVGMSDGAKVDPFLLTTGATDTYCLWTMNGTSLTLKTQLVLGGP